jgi:hypothetical protein
MEHTGQSFSSSLSQHLHVLVLGVDLLHFLVLGFSCLGAGTVPGVAIHTYIHGTTGVQAYKKISHSQFSFVR